MSAQAQMPQYQCHKKVWALKIKNIEPLPNPDQSGRSVSFSYGAVITPEDAGFAPFKVAADYMTRHKPLAGGYFVVYEGGYQSFSPADAFESGYTSLANVIKTTFTPPNQAAIDVLAERQRQVEIEGWAHKHDDKCTESELNKAAVCYLLYADAYPNEGEPPELWPWADEWWKPKNYRQDLVRAAALALAEIERFDRSVAALVAEPA